VYDHLRAAGVSPDIIELIPNAHYIAPGTLKPGRQWLLEEYDLPADATILCAAGRLVWAKGYDDLIAAFGLLRDTLPNLHCAIAGGGELHAALAAQIRRAGLGERIHLLGHLQRQTVWSLVNSSDVFVMTSRSEGTPVALLEAAALAKPIVATRAGGIPEIIAHGELGLLVDVGDTAGIANAVVRLVSDPEYARALGQRAKTHVDQHFGIHAQARATLEAYARAWQLAQRRLRARQL
jgi:glycosyltransferase involved in cell wall biosynthesis